MNRSVRIVLFLAVITAAAAGGYGAFSKYLLARSPARYRTATVDEGRVEHFVAATGTIKPVTSVSIGSFVSGPISKIYVDFNDEVTEGQLMAQVDPQLYDANVKRDEAALATRQAEVKRAQAQLQQAINDENRSIRLREKNKDFISQSEMDQYHFSRVAFEAQLALADAALKQAEANLANSQTNLAYTRIVSPVRGIVIDRKVDPGQTLAASFQTPELFIVAPDMDKEMHVYASVDEADIGMIRNAQLQGRPVRFKVDAYPDEWFEGRIHQIRKNGTVTQNVVTYPVVVSAPNPELKLLPGMTASIEFQIETRESILRVPNAALRFFPPVERVRPADRKLVAAAGGPQDPRLRAVDEDEEERARSRRRRHLWVQEGELLRAVEVRVGLSDNRYTEITEGDVKPGTIVVTGLDEARE